MKRYLDCRYVEGRRCSEDWQNDCFVLFVWKERNEMLQLLYYMR